MKKLFLISLAVIAIAYSPFLADSSPVNTITLTETDNGKTFEVSKGDTLTIELQAQLGTDYSWKLGPYHTLKLLKETVVHRNVPGVPLGGTVLGGIELQVFELRADAVGPNTLVFQYLKFDGKIEKEIHITVKVK